MKTPPFFLPGVWSSVPRLSRSRRRDYARVWRLTWPVILANLTIPLVGLVDTAVMGHLGSAHYIGAVALGSFCFGLIGISFGFFRMATTGLVAQAYGAGDMTAILTTLLRGVVIAVILGIAMILLAPFLIHLARLFFDAGAPVLDGMAQYVRITVFAMPAVFFNMVGLGMLFGMQRVRACTMQLIAVNGVNVAGNLLLVLGLGMKIEGVALATAIAHYAGAGLTVFLIAHAIGGFNTGAWAGVRREAVFDMGAMRRYFGMGRDLVIRTAGLLLGEMMVLNTSAALGDVELAATQLGFVVFRLVAYGLDGFAHAAESLVGHAIGSRDAARLARVIADSTRLAFLMAIALAACILLLAAPFFRLLTSLPDVLATTQGITLWLVLIPPLAVFTFQLDGIFIGATLARVMRDAMVISVAIFIPVILLAANYSGLHGIWAAFLFLLSVRGFTLRRRLGDVYAKAATP